MTINKAILLVGGKGTRLMPLTTSTPKPMIKVAGCPVTEHQIVKARDAGITEIVLATSYLADVFHPYFGDGSRFGLKIIYAVEEQPLGTGGAIANAAAHLDLHADESIFIFNGDVISAHDLRHQAELHNDAGADVTLHLVEVEDARAYGCVPTDSHGRVLQFLEKMDNPIANTINAGCYIFNKSVIDQIPHGDVVSVERDTFPKLLNQDRRIHSVIDSRYWIDMGTPASMIKVSRDLIENPSLSKATPRSSASSLIAPDATIAPSAEITSGTYIESGVRIDDGARVSGSIIASGATVESGAVIVDSYIAPGSRVVSGSLLRGEIFGF